MDVNTLDLDTTLEDSCLEFSDFINRDPTQNKNSHPKNLAIKKNSGTQNNHSNGEIGNLINSFNDLNKKNDN